MNRLTGFVLRLKSIMKKCREHGLFGIAIKLKEKYDKKNKS
jgi:hypothetical protein